MSYIRLCQNSIRADSIFYHVSIPIRCLPFDFVLCCCFWAIESDDFLEDGTIVVEIEEPPVE
jgi:hypothetical protein